ncbi:MAG: hypothetical protein WC647_11820 [Desulfomonilaceae bacterium]
MNEQWFSTGACFAQQFCGCAFLAAQHESEGGGWSASEKSSDVEEGVLVLQQQGIAEEGDTVIPMNDRQ